MSNPSVIRSLSLHPLLPPKNDTTGASAVSSKTGSTTGTSMPAVAPPLQAYGRSNAPSPRRIARKNHRKAEREAKNAAARAATNARSGKPTPFLTVLGDMAGHYINTTSSAVMNKIDEAQCYLAKLDAELAAEGPTPEASELAEYLGGEHGKGALAAAHDTMPSLRFLNTTVFSYHAAQLQPAGEGACSVDGSCNAVGAVPAPDPDSFVTATAQDKTVLNALRQYAKTSFELIVSPGTPAHALPRLVVISDMHHQVYEIQKEIYDMVTILFNKLSYKFRSKLLVESGKQPIEPDKCFGIQEAPKQHDLSKMKGCIGIDDPKLDDYLDDIARATAQDALDAALFAYNKAPAGARKNLPKFPKKLDAYTHLDDLFRLSLQVTELAGPKLKPSDQATLAGLVEKKQASYAFYVSEVLKTTAEREEHMFNLVVQHIGLDFLSIFVTGAAHADAMKGKLLAMPGVWFLRSTRPRPTIAT